MNNITKQVLNLNYCIQIFSLIFNDVNDDHIKLLTVS